MFSRFKSNTWYHTFVLFDKDAAGEKILKAYCCGCKNGLRTVGTCAHVTCVLWYLGLAQYEGVNEPVSWLNDYFKRKTYDSDDD